MAIVNATPDSFYSLSRTQSHDAVAQRVREVIAEGATIIDIGGYSSRPDADDVAVEEEWQRVKMAIEATREVSQEVAISVDTFRAEIVRRAVGEFGYIIVNDITAGKGDSGHCELHWPGNGHGGSCNCDLSSGDDDDDDDGAYYDPDGDTMS